MVALVHTPTWHQHVRVPFPEYPCPHLLHEFLMIVIRLGGGMEAHHNSDNISTMVINTENFFIYLLSICNSSETCLYKTSAYLLTSLFVFSSFAPHLF